MMTPAHCSVLLAWSLLGPAPIGGHQSGPSTELPGELPSCRRENPHPPPPGECCFGIKNCALKSPLTCPKHKAQACDTQGHCEGLCSHTPLGRSLWCPLGPDEHEGQDAAGHVTTAHPAPVFTRDDSATIVQQHPLGYMVIEETLYSQSYYLSDGDLVFTDFSNTPIPMPEGNYALLSLGGEMVDCNNVSVPLDTLYNHHWLLKPVSGPTTHYNAPCPANNVVLPQLNEYGDFTYVFGVGAESRNTPAVIPDGFGYHVSNGTEWAANIHVLHIRGLADGEQGIKECIECWAGEMKNCGNNARKNGTFMCCVVGGCPTSPGADMMPTEYKMQMKIRYTRDVEMVRPVDTETYLAPNCSYEYNAIAGGGNESSGMTAVGDAHLASSTWVVDKDKVRMCNISTVVHSAFH